MAAVAAYFVLEAEGCGFGGGCGGGCGCAPPPCGGGCGGCGRKKREVSLGLSVTCANTEWKGVDKFLPTAKPIKRHFVRPLECI